MQRTRRAALAVLGTLGCVSYTVKYDKLDPASTSYVMDATRWGRA